jgi:hypothetical protein
MKKESKGEAKRNLSNEDRIKIEKQVKDPVSNSPSDRELTQKQRSNREFNERMNREETVSDESPYDMGGTDNADEDRNPNLIPDDPIEAEQLESEKLRFGFSFEPKEGQTGDETDDEGDLTSDQRKTGNRYRPYLGVDDGVKDEENIANDQELHVTDTGHIGMAFGEDNYVDEDEEQKEDQKG